MKIKKIKKIDKFGIFNDFKWQDDCQDFEQYNFFYGWTYSGKTTFSRIFRCLETNVLHEDFHDARFSLETDNGNITQSNISNDYPVRVFNEDFIEDNFQWNNEDAKIEPVLILGKEAKELEDEAKKLAEQKGEKEKTFKDEKEDKESTERDLERSITEKASEIRNILGITNPKKFDKDKLVEKIESINNFYQDYILSDYEKKEKLDTYRSKKLEVINFKTPQLRVPIFTTEVKGILSEKITAQQIIEKLKENPRLSDWVRAGIPLHMKKLECQFCGNKLSPNKLNELNKHFSKEFDSLMENIEEETQKISDHIEDMRNLNLPDKARLFEDLQSEFKKSLNSLNSIKNNYILNLELLKKELKKKKEKPFDSLEIKRFSAYSQELTKSFQDIVSIINKHNLKIDFFITEKQQAKEKLIRHFTAEFIKKKNYFGIQDNIRKIEKNIQTLKLKIDKLNRKIEAINNKIKAEAIGANKINGYLNNFFNDDKLKIKLIEDGKYKLYRNEKVAKNLSTGEKNIISLVYFFSSLEETNFNFSNAVIFVDDPVSSLDSNHIYKVYGFINEKLKDCEQLFITTHNFDFFNLLKDLNKYDLKNKGKFYLVKKVKNQSDEFSIIENLPVVLGKYKSEYNYLFSILKSFNELNDKSNFELLYLLPNISRRFFEAYLFMRYPDGRKFNRKAETFLKDQNISDRQKTIKLIDEYSHEENPTHSRKFPDIEEVEDAIMFILKTIEEKDNGHYKALCDSLNTGLN